jgi:4-carboxymuconolactone decarboxylase
VCLRSKNRNEIARSTPRSRFCHFLERDGGPDQATPAASAPSAVPSDAQKAFGDIAPALARYTDEVLFGDVWKRPGLSPRDRSLVTVAALVAGYRTNELPFHLKRALDNGVTRDELIEAITHLAFYSGWPAANSALPIARRVFDEEKN